jgi:hypothetical protein
MSDFLGKGSFGCYSYFILPITGAAPPVSGLLGRQHILIGCSPPNSYVRFGYQPVGSAVVPPGFFHDPYILIGCSPPRSYIRFGFRPLGHTMSALTGFSHVPYQIMGLPPSPIRFGRKPQGNAGP